MASVFSNKVVLSCLVGLGVFLFLFGIIFGVAVRAKIDNKLKHVSRVCGKDSDAYDTWSTNTGDDAPAKFKMYYAFNASNAAAYLSQNPRTGVTSLKLNVIGPYAMRQYDTLYNISFFDDDRQVTYKTWSRFAFQPDSSCDGCDNTDYFTNINPGFLKTLTNTGSELLTGLLLSSADLSYGTRPTCNIANIKYSLSTQCNPGNDTKCCCNSTVDATNRDSCVVRSSNLYSTFASFDGGVEFFSPTLGKLVHSPLFITKNLHEFAYGYPSAMLGAFAGQGGNEAVISALAKFTELMRLACKGKYEGMSPHQDDEYMQGKPFQFLSLTTCKPLLGTLYWAKSVTLGPATLPACAFIGKALGRADACVCAFDNSLTTTEEHPCCTKAGLGCLYKVPGYVSSDLYLSSDQAYRSDPTDNTTQNTGCGSYDDHTDFSWTRYYGLTETPVWSQQGRAPYELPTQPEVQRALANKALFSFNATVVGDDGTRTKGTGVNSALVSGQLSEGDLPEERNVFITQVTRATVVRKVKKEKFRGIPVVRYSPYDDFLNRTSKANPPGIDNYKVGAATPFDGLQDGTFNRQFPVYVSRPMYLHGDPYLQTQVPATCATTPTAAACAGVQITVDGETPDFSSPDYDTYLLVEPSSGVTISGHKRLMASFGLYKCANVSQGCSPTSIAAGWGAANVLSPFVPGGKVIPQYYMDETSQATDDQIKKIKLIASLNHSAGLILIILPLIGGILAVASSVLLFKAHSRKRGSLIEASLLSDRSSEK